MSPTRPGTPPCAGSVAEPATEPGSLGRRLIRRLLGSGSRHGDAGAAAPTWDLVRSLEQRAAEAEARAEKAEARVAELEAQLGAALARITELGDENRRLRARLDQDSSNSSRPPSSEMPIRLLPVTIFGYH